MKFLNVIIVFLIAFSLSGIALYAVGPNLSTEAVVQNAMKQLEESGKMEEMVQQIEADPEVYEYMEQLETQMQPESDGQETEMEEQAVADSDEDYGESIDMASPAAPAQENLAFETKEDAASVMMEKVGFRNLLKMKNAVENDTMTAQEVMNELDEDLNEEEMLALKVMIFQEWQNRK